MSEHRKVAYMDLLASGKRKCYLTEIDKQAEDMRFQLIKQYALRQEITEQLKVENLMEWVGRINNIQVCIREVIYNELVYV